MRILVVEDDPAVREFLRESLEEMSYAVTLAQDGEAAERFLEEERFNLILLDLNIPKRDGFEVLHSLEGRMDRPAVLVLTERSRVEDRIRGLDAGADDYLPKPFSLAELSARIRALHRRARAGAAAVLRVGDLEIDRLARTARRQNQTIPLTPREFALLEYLACHAGRCVTRAMIIENVWKFVPETMTNVVDVYINYLRSKVDAGYPQKLIRTVRGIGYQMGLPPRAVAHGS
jgi:two-component system copper resistance phosphate regulon response regulator CusR